MPHSCVCEDLRGNALGNSGEVSKVSMLTSELGVTNIFCQAPNYSRCLRTLMNSMANT